MAVEFLFPDVGEGIHEGEIVRWLIKEGDEVKEDQAIIEVETAKAIVEIPSPKTGTILHTQGKDGETINVGDLLAVIGEKGESWAPSVKTPAAAAPAQTPATAHGGVSAVPTPITTGAVSQPATPAAAEEAAPGVVGSIPTDSGGVVLPSRKPEPDSAKTAPAAAHVLPMIRQKAAELGVDLTQVRGTGPGGMISIADVQMAAGKTSSMEPAESELAQMPSPQSAASAAAPSSKTEYEKFGVVRREPLKGLRKAIAEHMVKSVQTMPQVTHTDEFDATTLVGLRTTQKVDAEKKGIKLTYLAYFVQAVAGLLHDFPALNATVDDATKELVYKDYINIGIAVDTPEGLMVPVIKDAANKDIFTIAREIIELAAKAQERKLSPAEMEGASFTITNIGSVGGITATPIIPYGQSAILGLYRMKERPVALEGEVAIRPMMTLTLTFDHRIADGAQAGRFVNALIAELEKQSS
ncbi:dienelactone hydrolase [Candidatus Peregrinibacteria bacterium CG_4_9_14_0_2_um_filter_53_11]|nr:MAG: dienelactone hydrolase [Candidatus Peregrinibacteria bacterium CG_4_9_14_0_2_um_filter_53_11]